MKLKHLHADFGIFNGSLIFLLDNKLLSLSFGTPNFNDYGEWYIDEISYSKNDYQPDANTVELKPFKSIVKVLKDVEINEEDLKFIKYISDISDTEVDLKESDWKKYETKYPEYDHNLITMGYLEDNKEPQIVLNIKGKQTITPLSEWKATKTLSEPCGLITLMSPILGALMKNFNKELKKRRKKGKKND